MKDAERDYATDAFTGSGYRKCLKRRGSWETRRLTVDKEVEVDGKEQYDQYGGIDRKEKYGRDKKEYGDEGTKEEAVDGKEGHDKE